MDCNCGGAYNNKVAPAMQVAPFYANYGFLTTHVVEPRRTAGGAAGDFANESQTASMRRPQPCNYLARDEDESRYLADLHR